MKLAVIGGGSTYTPELADGLGRLAPQVTELVLVDPDEARLAVVGPVSARIMRAHGHQAVVRWTTDAEDGVDGAAAVLIQLRVGGQAARDRDETWPLDFCCVGQETTGAGGLAKALRTVPLVLQIAELARQRAAPGAWLIDFTNPVGMVTRALLDAGHRAVGLCNVAIGLQRYFASLLGVAPESVSLDHVGLNHLTWERAVRVDGTDRLPELLAGHLEEIADHVAAPESVLSAYSFVPSYYLRYYYLHDSVVAEQQQDGDAGRRGRGDRGRAAENVRGPGARQEAGTARQAGRRVLLGGRGRAARLADRRRRGRAGRQRAQWRHLRLPGRRGGHRGAAVIGCGGPVPVPTAPLSPLLRGLVAHMSAYEELAVDAALRGGRPRVVSALLAHPLIGQYDLAEKMADRMIAENARFLSWA